jgi:hypothetical protein
MWKVFQLVIIGAVVWAAQQSLPAFNGLIVLVVVAVAVCVALIATKLVRAALDALPRRGFREGAE